MADMTDGSTPIIEVRGLEKSFGNLAVLKGVDLSIRTGEINFFIGPSGGGKSTLLRCINFLDVPTGGEIRFDGEALCGSDGGSFRVKPEARLRAARRKMPMVFQQFHLFAHRTVLENVIEGPIHVLGRARDRAIADAEAILAEVGLAQRLDHYPDQLSGGQKQRVAIARALAMEPKVVLFDEPTSALDPELVAGVLDTIRTLAEAGMTLAIVTHEMGFARKLADRIHFVADGVILESGAPDMILAVDHDVRGRIGQFLRAVER
ncbi:MULTISPECIES: amino acid ABC transporter ATP-binding protein [unclassified Burkholderia]|uniref:amino acid ABC transporter ATP-binding protein n=1 Tax=unclassified Burkholderia TaxID=2613784 RepID=UPI000A639E02|nr:MULTISPECIES: amino acid ABC transporter ATP-binding protein [unclassified Burkholderia]